MPASDPASVIPAAFGQAAARDSESETGPGASECCRAFEKMSSAVSSKAVPGKVQPKTTSSSSSTLSVSGKGSGVKPETAKSVPSVPKTAPAGNQRKIAPKVAGAVKTDKPAAASGNSSDADPAKKMRQRQYRNLIDPKTQEQRKAEHILAFEKLKNLSVDDLQIEFIVCIRAGS